MIEETFGARFGYLRWLRFLRDGDAASWAEIGRAIGRTGQAISAWGSMREVPTDYRLHRPLLDYFELKDGEWLIEGRGNPPMPDLWSVWLQARRADVKAARPGTQLITRSTAKATKTGRKTAAKTRRGA